MNCLAAAAFSGIDSGKAVSYGPERAEDIAMPGFFPGNRSGRGNAANALARTAVVALLLSLAWPRDADAAKGRLPDGAYHCEAYLLGLFLDLGTISIKGDVYSGPTYGGRTAQGYNYQITSNGELTWLGPLGGFTAGGNRVSLTQVTADGPEDASFDIVMRQPDGAFTAATCTIQPASGQG